MGINRVTTKLGVFALSAGLAGFGGALLAMQRESATTDDFDLLGPVGLSIVILAVAGGVSCVSGALFGGFAFILFIIIKESVNNAWHVATATVIGVIIVASIYPRLTERLVIVVRLSIAVGAAVIGAFVVGWFFITNYEESWLVAIERLGPALLVIGVIVNPNGAVVGLGFLFSPLLPWRHDDASGLEGRNRAAKETARRQGRGAGGPQGSAAGCPRLGRRRRPSSGRREDRT